MYVVLKEQKDKYMLFKYRRESDWFVKRQSDTNSPDIFPFYLQHLWVDVIVCDSLDVAVLYLLHKH